MAGKNISDYQSATLAPPLAEIGSGDERWVLVYNNTGSAITNGAINEISFLVDTGTLNSAATTALPMIIAVPKALATSAGECTMIGVADNSKIDKSTIPDATYGYFKVAGVIQAMCNGGADIAIGDQLEILNTAASFIVAASASSGASGLIVPECAAIALEAYTTGSDALKYVYLPGRYVQVKAS
jgi:hypothetical protein